MTLNLDGLTNDDFVALVRREVASAGLCGSDSLDDARSLLAEAARRIEEVRATLRREIGFKIIAGIGNIGLMSDPSGRTPHGKIGLIGPSRA